MKRKALINIVYHQKLNGNMPAEPVHKQGILLVTMGQSLMNMRGTIKIQVLKLIQLARRNLIPGIFMICMGMSGNGFRTDGMINTKVLLPMVVPGKMEMART